VFSKLVNTWASLSHTVLVLAGTGLRLLDSLALVASAVFKSEDMQDLLIVDFDMYDQLESMQAYITQFFPVPPSIMDDIFSILTGIKNAVLGKHCFLTIHRAHSKLCTVCDSGADEPICPDY
jgi:hypothetical protein